MTYNEGKSQFFTFNISLLSADVYPKRRKPLKKGGRVK
jgi:hypothetical protein